MTRLGSVAAAASSTVRRAPQDAWESVKVTAGAAVAIVRNAADDGVHQMASERDSTAQASSSGRQERPEWKADVPQVCFCGVRTR